MNKKRAKLKAIVIAFALVFSGFAALMLVPQSVAAADPSVTSAEATDIGTTYATLNMTFDMGDYTNVTAYFMYNVTGQALDQRTGEHEYETGNTTHTVDLTGLATDTQYDFKAVVAYYNTTDSTHYTDETVVDTFTTPVATVSTLDATDIGTTSATLNMEFEMGDLDNVTVHFNWTDDAWTTWNTTEEVMYEDAANDTTHHEVLMGLDANSTYHYKAVLVYNVTGEETIMGDVLTFDTAMVTVTTLEATDIGTSSATLNMEFEMGIYNEVEVWFEMNGTMVEGSNTTYGADNTTHSFGIINLTVNTTYEYKAVLNYTSGEIYGDNVTFTTPFATVTTLDATDVGTTAATLNMEFEMGDFAEVEVWFEMDSTMVEDSNTTYGAENTTHSFDLSELTANTIYTYTAVLTYTSGNDTVTMYGDEVEFITYSSVAIVGDSEILVDVDTTFEADVTGTGVNYTWTVDGTIVGDDADSVILNFTTIGPRTIGLTIIDDNGLEATASHVVDVQVEVTITVDDGNDTIEGIDVSLRGDLGYSESNTTGTDGTVVFTVYSVSGEIHADEPAAMEFEVTASHADYMTKTENFTGVEHTISLAGQTEWAVIIGPVQDGEGVAVPGAEVQLTWNDGSQTGVTDVEGWVIFTFDFNPYDESFTVVVTHPDYRIETVSFTGSVSGAIVLSGVPYELVIGPVVDAETDDPIVNAVVTVTLDDWSADGVTDENGETYFDVLGFNPDDIDTYHVVVVHAEYMETTVEEYVLGDTIEMAPIVEDYTVSVGPLKDRAGKFVNDATVTISWNPNETLESGVNGMYVFDVDFDPSGTEFTYTISHPDLDEDVTGTFTGANSGSMDLEVGDEPVEAEDGMSMALIGGLAVLILIIIVVVVMMMKKKPAEEVDEEEEFEEEEPLFEEEEDLFEEEEEEPLFEEEEELFEEEEEEPLFEEEEDLFEEEEEEEPLFEDEEL